MIKKTLPMVCLFVVSLLITGCKNKTEEANTSEAEAAAVSESTSEKFTVNVTESTIEWKGYKPTGTHNGTISLDNGVFKTNNGKLQSGTFLIDMNSISVSDLEAGDGKEDLEAHLKGIVEGKENHFFDVLGARRLVVHLAHPDGLAPVYGPLVLLGRQRHNFHLVLPTMGPFEVEDLLARGNPVHDGHLDVHHDELVDSFGAVRVPAEVAFVEAGFEHVERLLTIVGEIVTVLELVSELVDQAVQHFLGFVQFKQAYRAVIVIVRGVHAAKLKRIR